MAKTAGKQLVTTAIDDNMHADLKSYCHNDYSDMTKTINRALREYLIKNKHLIKNPKSDFLK